MDWAAGGPYAPRRISRMGATGIDLLASGLEVGAATGARQSADLACGVALECDPDAECRQEEIVIALRQHLARIVTRLPYQLRAFTADLDDEPIRDEELADIAIELVGRRNVGRMRPMKLVATGTRRGIARHDERAGIAPVVIEMARRDRGLRARGDLAMSRYVAILDYKIPPRHVLGRHLGTEQRRARVRRDHPHV